MPTVGARFDALARDEAEDRLLSIAETVRPHFGILARVIGDSGAPFPARARAAELALSQLQAQESIGS